jgi:hypothetical protein
MVYKPRQLALRVWGRDVVLTKVQNRLERNSGRKTTTTSGGRARALAEEEDAGALQAPGLHGSTRGAPAKPVEGSVGPERHRRRAIAPATNLPETASKLNSGVPVGGGRGRGAAEEKGGGGAAGLQGCCCG